MRQEASCDKDIDGEKYRCRKRERSQAKSKRVDRHRNKKKDWKQ